MSMLRAISLVSTTDIATRVATGCAALDLRVGGGLARSALHEVVAERSDAAAACGFAAMMATRAGGQSVWLRLEGAGGGRPHAPGWREIGLDPRSLLLVSAPDATALLRAAGEAARNNAVSLVVIELWSSHRLVDLTAGRRLQLAAEASGALLLLLRIGSDPVPSPARTRWAVRAASSRPLAANAPGSPALDLELLRQRGSPAGGRWRVEWDRDRSCFAEAPIPGALVSVPHRRSA